MKSDMKLKTFKFETKADVAAFINYLLKDLSLAFDPDLPFAEYQRCDSNVANEPTFSVEQAEQLDRTLDDCHTWCSRNNEDIYEIALDCFNKWQDGFQQVFVTDFKEVIAHYPELRYSTAYTYNSGRTLVIRVQVNQGFKFDDAAKEKVLLEWMGEFVPEHKSRYTMMAPDGLALCYNAAQGIIFDLYELK